jgi:hypothetical protein
MRQLAGIGGYVHVHMMMRDLDSRDGVSSLPSLQTPAKVPQEHYITTGSADPEADLVEWNRMRTRRFRPDLSAAIDRCTSKAQMAAACGYDGPSKLFSVLSEWEAQNGLLETTRQQRDVFKGAVTKALQERAASRPKKGNAKKKAKSKKNSMSK